MARNRNAPAGLQKTSDRGAPWVSIALAFVVGLIFFLPFPGWQKLVTFITSATVLSFGAGPLVWAALRNRLPDHERPFRVPGGHVIPFLAFLSSNLIVYWAGWTTNWKLFVAILIGFGLLGAQAVFARDRMPRDGLARRDLDPPLARARLRSSPTSARTAGAATHTLAPGVGAAVIFGISVAIYLAAYRLASAGGAGQGADRRERGRRRSRRRLNGASLRVSSAGSPSPGSRAGRRAARPAP